MMKKNLKLKYIIALIVLLIITLGIVQTKGYAQENRGNNVGDYAYEFSLVNLAGEEVSLSDYRGQKVVVNFWATWCPPCREEMPDLDRFNANYNDLVVLGVNVAEAESTVRNFIEEGGYEFPILLDETREIARQYHVSAYPTTYFINETGQIVDFRAGMLTESQLEYIYQNKYDSFSSAVSRVDIQRAFSGEQDNIINNSNYFSVSDSLMSRLDLELGDKVNLGYGETHAVYEIVESRNETSDIVRMGLSGRERLGQSDPFSAYLSKLEEVEVEKALFSLDLQRVVNNSNYCSIDSSLLDRLGLEIGDEIVIRAQNNTDEYAIYTIVEALDEGEDIIRMGLNGRRRVNQDDPFSASLSIVHD